jgi:hypothetical protein
MEAVVDGSDLGAPHWLQLTRLMNWEWAFNELGNASPGRGSPADTPICRSGPVGPVCPSFLNKLMGTSLDLGTDNGDILQRFPDFRGAVYPLDS